MATKTEKAFERALLDLAGEDLPTALSVLTGCFVSLTLEMVKRAGHDTDRDIKVDGGDQRDITIHAPKVTPNAQVQGRAGSLARPAGTES
jgi:hypothetical protein